LRSYVAAKNPNIEIRNKRQKQNTKGPNIENSKQNVLMFRSFEFGSFDIVSDFGFRAADLNRCGTTLYPWNLMWTSKNTVIKLILYG
jgi:hypothetical protein